MFGNDFFTLTLFTLVNPFFCAEDGIMIKKLHEGAEIASITTLNLYGMFIECIGLSMPNQHFIVDDPKSFVNYPSKTTVGFAPKFTSNRKFFANMINTAAFKEMIAADEEALRKNLVKKMRYCDQVVMDQNILIDLYDREVDQTKI